jgi:molybdopterin molybdotransferase
MMISVEQALAFVENNITFTDHSEQKKVSDAIGCTLSKDINSPINMPPFRQSAMDGYALSINDYNTYTLIGEVKAGDNHHPLLQKGEAIRIFTGAPVPNSANAVIMQEKTSVNQNILSIDGVITLNENIRPLGEQVTKDQIALKKGTLLTPAAIAFITSLGITKISVYKKPSIAIVVTGNELAEAGQDLAFGQIYESNATMLIMALKRVGYTNVSK